MEGEGLNLEKNMGFIIDYIYLIVFFMCLVLFMIFKFYLKLFDDISNVLCLCSMWNYNLGFLFVCKLYIYLFKSLYISCIFLVIGYF